MKKTAEDTLINIYNNLRLVIEESSKGKKQDSLYLFLHKKTYNAAVDFLTKCGVRETVVSLETLNYLKDKNYIFEYNNENLDQMITINASGIYYLEKKDAVLTVDDLLNVSNKNWKAKLPTNEDNTLKDPERLVLLSLLGMRAFNLNHCIDLNSPESKRLWLEIFKVCNEFIVENNLGKYVNILDNDGKGNQPAVFALMTRIENLPKKTNLYLDNGKTKKKCYFLNVENNLGDIDEDKVAFLMERICEANNNVYMELNDFLINLYTQHWTKVYSQPTYGGPSIDSTIQNSTMLALER